MARRRAAGRRVIPADPRYDSVLLTRFIHKVMLGGKKTKAQKAVYSALEALENEVNRPAVEIFEQAVRNATPALEVKSRRVGGATYQVPTEVRPDRRTAMALRWLVAAARARAGRPMHRRLYEELLEASRGQGSAVRRREELHRMAEANRAFAHYRW
jgi:small subunit ribosomal protein S7